ncbi:MAG: ABC transporter ATP-binding protein [Dehalococcoidia bacterium]|nr:ABC transporter ATP-binding protein [Dehalococcoidia bacterium]
MLEARGVSRAFQTGKQQVVAVDQVSLEVRRGEFIALIGRSGSGKTTLLNLLAGLDQPTSGSILFDGRDLAGVSEAETVELRRKTVGFVFQSFGLLPLLSAYENVELPLRINGVGARERRQRVDQVLKQVGLGKRAHHRPYELSGGEQQRVAIARALAARPQVIFADEPTGELDSLTGEAIAHLLRDVSKEENITVVVATHDLRLSSMTDRVLEMEDGRLRLSAKPSLA